MRHSGLTFDDFEDILDLKLQLSEVVIHLVSSEWTLLVVRKWFLHESTTLATLVVDGGISMLRLWFCSIDTMVERLVCRAFHCFLQLDIQLGSVQDLTPTGDIVLYQMLVQRVGDS